MPRTFGDTVIHESHIDVMVENDFPLHERKLGGAASAEEKKIGQLIANELVDNGATLQMGKIFPLYFLRTSRCFIPQKLPSQVILDERRKHSSMTRVLVPKQTATTR